MIAQEIIRRKRDGHPLSADDISDFVAALASGTLSEGQVAAFAMAVWFRGMSNDETVALTLAMRDSGEVLSWEGIGRPVADKHSTGGVGDNVSLMLAPIVAACGLAVPMISGRGLGHTGGTLDKLESIPGYGIMPDAATFRRVVKTIGCAVIGQTTALAPADRRLYAIRDVTATVDSIALITASILSKKLAAGLEVLTLDVKVGNGAFMTSREDAEGLARSLVDVARGAGVEASALLTDMNQPLADAAGNVLEVENCIAFLRGEKAGTRLQTVVIAFATEMLMQAGVCATASEAAQQARNALDSGRAADIFGRMVHALGGPAGLLDNPGRFLIRAPVILPVSSPADGYLAACDTRRIGMEVIALGGGRLLPSDGIDHRVGFEGILPLGTQMSKGQPIAMVHAADADSAARAASAMLQCYRLSDDAPDVPAPVVSRL